jgi:transcriptional regulator GlxA family with amidase domain
MEHAEIKKTAKALFVVPVDVQLLDITGPAHIYHEAEKYGAPIQSYFVSQDSKASSSRSSSGLEFSNLKDFASFELTSEDLIFVPGLDPKRLFDAEFLSACRPFHAWLQQQHANGASICSVCTGAFVLAEAGLFDNTECTTHWNFLDRFQDRFPKALLQKNRLFVDAGSLYSSAGVASGIDLALYLLEKRMGSSFAALIAREVVVYLRRTDSDPQLSVFLEYRNHIDDDIHTVQNLMAQSLHEKLTIEGLADQVNMSPRNLTRLFKKATYITIGQYLDKLRVERAVKILAQGHKISVAASECGLKSPNQLRNLLKKYRGILPGDLQNMS